MPSISLSMSGSLDDRLPYTDFFLYLRLGYVYCSLFGFHL